MPMPLKDIPIGTTFGFLSVLAHQGGGIWLCRCVCGSDCKSSGTDLRKGGARQSCGCKRRESQALGKTTHGKSGTRTYKAWKQMIARCTLDCADDHGRYKARGITVCERWRNSFEDFLADVGEKPTLEHSIDRIDNDGNYEPGNCRWSTDDEQRRNRSDNVWIEFNGQRKILNDWATTTGLRRETISRRLRAGWSPVDALTTPP